MALTFAMMAAAFLLPLAHAIRYAPDLPPGPYCQVGQRTRCCDGRQDQCSAPILGTLCYCDDFCDRARNDDCCPDYWSVCRGVTDPPPAPLHGCVLPGTSKTVPYRGSVKTNCNVCKCEVVTNVPEMLCETNVCLIDTDIVDTVNANRAQHGWQASNHSEFWGRTLDDGVALRLGTLQPHGFVLRMMPVKRIYDPTGLPREFDAETVWPGWITSVQDQGWCAASWAISTAAIASDRYAIISKGLERPHLSAQHLLSCDSRGQQSCHGGHLDRAWNFFRKYGIVDEKCFPYRGRNEKCNMPRGGNLLTARCTPPRNVDRKDYYRVGPAYRLGNETDIMYDMIKSGPVQATMKVYHDFFMYQSGIYKHTELSSTARTGYHSVRIVGWGEEYGQAGVQKYWKVANSWGPDWGERGYFRIARGINECDIESFVLGSEPEIAPRAH